MFVLFEYLIKLNSEYGLVKNKSNDEIRKVPSHVQQDQTSSELVLTGMLLLISHLKSTCQTWSLFLQICKAFCCVIEDLYFLISDSFIVGNHESKDSQKEGDKNALPHAPTTLPRGLYVHLVISEIAKLVKLNTCV